MSQLLGNMAVGSIVYLNESGNSQPYLVVNQGNPDMELYDNSCNGTWLLRQNILNTNQWDSSNSNDYENSTIDSYLNSTFLGYFDVSLRQIIVRAKIPYRPGAGISNTISSGANGLSAKVFLLSGAELNISNEYTPSDGATLNYFSDTYAFGNDPKRVANFNGTTTAWWTRTPYCRSDYGSTRAAYIDTEGHISQNNCKNIFGIRPALIMPLDVLVDDSNNITATQILQIGSVSVPSLGMVGESLPISWNIVSSSDYTINYQLQRNYNNTGWETVSSNLNINSYTDIPQLDWTQVQYQVMASTEGISGPYATSSIIPITNPSALIISGQDQNLGTITSNIPYTVSSNTGNPISLTRTVNGAQVVTLTVNSGFAYSIPIVDLPTGTGTIIITATVDTGSDPVTKTRTWTYYKTPINIPSTGGIAQLTQNGQNIWPVTVPDAVEAPVYLGGNLSEALNLLGQAALYTAPGKPLYNQVNIDLNKVNVGDEISLPYNGVMVPHIVVHIGNPNPSLYDASCDGVWLLRKDCAATGPWNSIDISTLAGSTIMSTMAGDVSNYDNSVSSQIKTVKIPYCVGGNDTAVNTLGNGLECQIFPLSAYELGWTTSYVPELPIDGAVLSYFRGTDSTDSKRIAYFNNSAIYWWLRTPKTYLNRNNYAYHVSLNGDIDGHTCISNNGIRPTFIMPTTFTATYYVDFNNNVYTSQGYAPGGPITDVFGYGLPITQYEIGTYVGTGTHGELNPTSISVTFIPKFVCITNTTYSYERAILPYGGYGFMFNDDIISSTSIDIYGLNATWSSTSVSWYNVSKAIYQMNRNGTTYQYVIFG